MLGDHDPPSANISADYQRRFPAELIKEMPPGEQAEVVRFLRELEAQQRARCVDDKTFEASADRILDRHGELLRKLAS